MEKLFEVLEAAFNWSFKLRRRLRRQIAIEKNEVSKAQRRVHASHKWYARKPSNIAGVNKNGQRVRQGAPDLRKKN
jgi:hypothetical protein